MKNGIQNNENLSEQEKMDSLVAEIAGDADVSDNDSADSEDKDNLKADPVEEIPQYKTDNTEKENLSEQEKMDSLVAEIAGDADVSDNDSADSENKDNLKADPVEEIPQYKTDNTEKENLSEQEKMDSLVAEIAGDADVSDNDDFSSLDDDEIESFYSDNLNEKQNSTKIDVKENSIEDTPQNKDKTENLSEQENKNNKTEENKDNIEKKLNSSIKKKKINKYNKQILLKKYTKPLVLLCLLLLIFFSLWFVYYKDKSASENTSEKHYSLTHEQQLPRTNTVKQHEAPLPEKTKEPFLEEPVFEETNINPSQLDVFIENLNIIIDKLKATQNDLDVFLRYYNDEIKNLEENIVTEIKTKNIKTFQDAIKNMRIKLGLETIQRRLFYIDKFQKPFNKLNCDIEELIFLKRKIKIAINIIPIISEQEIKNFEKSIKTIILKHISVTDKLFTDNNSTNKLESLESIWSALPCSTEKKKTKKKITSSEIWKELSDGNFTNTNNLTRLSIEAAKCLSKWKGKDLYLNNIKKLTPEITKEIVKWKGDWLCLNGLSAISPEVAKILFSWEGKRISLNGIKEISEKEAEYISRWNGKELEIINLKYFSPAAAAYLTKWLKRGGNIYIDDKFQ